MFTEEGAMWQLVGERTLLSVRTRQSETVWERGRSEACEDVVGCDDKHRVHGSSRLCHDWVNEQKKNLVTM